MKIIMNPPYDRNLHLKILSQCVKHIGDGEIVNLSPIRWLQDPLAENKKNSDFKKFADVRNHISSLEEVKAKDSQKLFGIGVAGDLGVYYLNKDGGFDCSSIQNNIVKKIYQKTIENMKMFEENKKDGWRVKISKAFGRGGHNHGGQVDHLVWQNLIAFYDGMKDGKPWYEFYNTNQYSKTTPEITNSIKFDTEGEANNFISINSSKLGKYYYNKMNNTMVVKEFYYLWLNDYTHPWTDEELYKYFDLTEDEIKQIEEEMEKYK